MDYIKHDQYVHSVTWRALVHRVGIAMFGSRWSGVPFPFAGWGAVMDATRRAYNMLWTDFIELTAECARLWDEVRGMRGVIAAWKVEQERQARRIAELEREKTARLCYVQPKAHLYFECRPDGGYTVIAKDQFGGTLAEQKVPAPTSIKALQQLTQDYEALQALYRTAQAQLATPAPTDDRVTAWNKVYDAIRHNWWSAKNPGRGDCGMDRAVNAIEDMAKAAKATPGGYELTMDVRETKVIGRVYELESYSSGLRKQMLCVREVNLPHFDKALAVNEGLKKENDELRARLEKRPQPRVHIGVQDDAVFVTNEQGGELARAPLPPVTYGVDFSGKDGEHTVVTVRQGAKVLYVIDVSAERKRLLQEAVAKRNLFGMFNYAGIEARVVAHIFGAESKVNVAIVPQKNEVHDRWTARRAAYDRGQDVRRRNGRLFNHGKYWNPGDDANLREWYRCGLSLYDIAVRSGREWEAVLYRLAHLGRWPKAWLRPGNHEKFLHRAWTWFFVVTGSPLPRTDLRLNALCRVPGVFP